MKAQRLFCILLIGLVAACRSDAMTIKVNFDHMAGLAKGDRVLVENEDAGRIRSVAVEPDGSCRAVLDVARGFSGALTQYARFYVVEDPGRSGHEAVDIRVDRKGGMLLADGATVAGVSPDADGMDEWSKGLEKGFRSLEDWARQYGREFQKLPENKTYRDLKQSLLQWAAEMNRAGQEARKDFERKWLPRIQQGLDGLSRWLREQGPKENGPPPPARQDGSPRNI